MGFRKADNKTNDAFARGRTITSGLTLLYFGYFFFLVVLLPLFFEGGYETLGEAKGILFLRTTVFAIVLTVLLFAVRLKAAHPGERPRLTQAEAMLLVFFGLQIISTVLSPNPRLAFFGLNAWRTGLLAQLSFLYIYFAFRNYGAWEPIHRVMVYGMTVLMEGMTLLFLPGVEAMQKGKDLSFATLGNSNWFLGPMVLAIAYAIGSFAMRKTDKKEFACMIAAVAGGIPCLLLTGTSTGRIMSIWLVLCGALIVFGRKRSGFRAALYGVVTVSLCIPVIACLGMETGMLSLPDAFGNGRGFIWNLCAEAWRSLPLSGKLLGVGPDSVSRWLYENPAYEEILTQRYGDVFLSNAHSDLMTKMLQIGILGTVSYLIAIFCILGKWICAMKEKEETASKLMRFLFPATACFLMNAVLFEHVLVTPYFYLLLGAGEWYCEKYVGFPIMADPVFDEIRKTCYDTNGVTKKNEARRKDMKHIQTLDTRDMAKSAVNGGCGECQTSCQSACKTSCGIANQECENEEE